MSRFSCWLGVALGGVLAISLSQPALACACGCGVFDVGTTSMFPTAAGGMAYLGYDYQNQNQDWAGSSKAPAVDNADKRITTSFVTAGVQYMFNRDWGVNVEVPVWNRTLLTDNNWPAPPEALQHYDEVGIGDVRIKAIYTGLSADMSTGLTLGVKLPTGNTSFFGDADSEIGAGATDVLPGFFQRGHFTSNLAWFVNGQADVPVVSKQAYRPGAEADLAVGVHTNGWDFGKFGLVTPEFQLVGAWRAADSGWQASPSDSGYRRLIASPGVEWDIDRTMVNFNVDLPVVVNTTGYQLVAFPLVKLTVGYMF